MNLSLSHIVTFLSLILNPQNDALKLAPIKEPAPILFAFETVGWKILAIVIFILLLIFLYKWIQHYKKNTYRRVAIKRLSTINANSNKSINESAIILKTVAITAYGRENVAALYGTEWLLFLESKGKNTLFTKYTTSFLAAQNSNPNIDISIKNEILTLTKKWIQTHA